MSRADMSRTETSRAPMPPAPMPPAPMSRAPMDRAGLSRAAIADGWQARLAQWGLVEPAELLNDQGDRPLAAGTWERLSKPGLAGRQRWRWRPPPGPADEQPAPTAAGAAARAGDDGEAPVLYVKRYAAPSLREQWDRLLRQRAGRSRAWWEFEQARRLAEAHIPTARAIAFAERMRGPIERRSAVVLERVPGEAFDRLWPKLEQAGAPLTRGAARREIARRLGRFVSAFHNTGLCHRDLYLCHIFAELDPDGASPPRFALIDLARTHRPRLRRTRWLIKDLAQLDYSACQIGASRAERFRCLRAYLGLEPRAARARWFARKIARKSERIRRRDERRSPSR